MRVIVGNTGTKAAVPEEVVRLAVSLIEPLRRRMSSSLEFFGNRL